MIGPNSQVVYVMRNPMMRAISIQKKDGGNTVANSLVDWNDPYTSLATKTEGIAVYTVLYERFFLDPEREAKKLPNFIGLEYDKIDVSGIDPKRTTFLKGQFRFQSQRLDQAFHFGGQIVVDWNALPGDVLFIFEFLFTSGPDAISSR